MGTRATIAVKDEYNTFYIYRHSDGYPDDKHGVLADLSLALPFAWPLPRYEAMDFAAAIIRAWKTGPGGIYFTSSHEVHSDTEYQYDIEFKNGQLICHWREVGGRNKKHVIWMP